MFLAMVPTTDVAPTLVCSTITRSSSAPNVIHWSKYYPPTHISSNTPQVKFLSHLNFGKHTYFVNSSFLSLLQVRRRHPRALYRTQKFHNLSNA